MKSLIAFLALAATAVAPVSAFAWGGTGHRLIGLAAARALPPELPAFLRTPQAVDDVGELALEPDNSKQSGKEHDLEMQSGHFVDIDENGKILGGPPFATIPITRDAYEKLLQPFGLNSWQVGYLPFSIFERYQILAKDFATWRVIVAAQANPDWVAHRAYYNAERRRREALILIHMGDLAHYVGDGSQPLHTSNHFNGWGNFPNPNNYTQAKIHAPFEGEFVTHNLDLALVEAKMTPLTVCDCAMEQEVTRYLTVTAGQVEPLYQLEKAGALNDGDQRMIAFAAAQLAAGASETRNLVVEAWRASPNLVVGWRPVTVADVVAGKVEPYKALRVVDLSPVPQFGTPEAGRTYADRPAAFGIARREGRIAMVQVAKPGHPPWLDLPGGAIDPGEDAAQAVVREFGEETGLRIESGRDFARADQLFINTDGRAYNNRATFFAVAILGEAPELKIEDDHELVWVDPDRAVRELRHDAHAWAVAAWLRRVAG